MPGVGWEAGQWEAEYTGLTKDKKLSWDGGVDISPEHLVLTQRLIHPIQPWGYTEPELFSPSLVEATD